MSACLPAVITRAVGPLLLAVVLIGLCITTFPAAYATPRDQAVPFAVDLRSRQAALDLFTSRYLPGQQVAIDWTGDDATCSAGTTAASFRAATLQRINYYRAMAGVDADVALSAAYNEKAQQAALMMLANGRLDHTPPQDWKCYSSDGATAAGSSNLSWGSIGPAAIDRQMRDAGTGNYFVGHRRWLVYPQTKLMGTGDVETAHALWVIDENLRAPRPATRDGFVAWPPPGYVPHRVVYPRWSFSYPNADFSQASVTITQHGAAVPVALEKIETGFGENTLVWIPLGLQDTDLWPRPISDTPYTVTISNVLIDGTPRQFSYSVTVFDPDEANDAASSTPTPPPPPARSLTKKVFVPFLRR